MNHNWWLLRLSFVFTDLEDYLNFGVSSRTLMKAKIPIVNDLKCEKFSKHYKKELQICAGGEKGKINFKWNENVRFLL